MLARKVLNLPPSATEAVDNQVKTMRRQGIDDIVSLGVGEPCFETPKNIRRAAMQGLERGNTRYQPTAGDFGLREAIADKLKKENRIDARVEDIVVTAGGKFAIFLAFQAVLAPGDTILLVDPCWVSYEPAAMLAGAKVVRVPTDAARGFQPDLDRIAAHMDGTVKMVVVNSPCNPTGAVFSPDDLRRIAELAQSNGSLLVSDEVYEYQCYGTAVHYSPAAEFDNVITVNAFSKSFAMTGWRLGYAVAPGEVIQGMLKIYQHSTSCVTAFAQDGALEALKGKESQKAALDMRRGYADRRELMIDLINACEHLSLPTAPWGAFYCFPSFSAKMSSVEMARRLLKEVHVATLPGAAFGECGEGHLRLSYASTTAEIQEAFRRINAFFASRGDESAPPVPRG